MKHKMKVIPNAGLVYPGHVGWKCENCTSAIYIKRNLWRYIVVLGLKQFEGLKSEWKNCPGRNPYASVDFPIYSDING